MADPKELTADQCRDKAAECFEMAVQATSTHHQIMLQHMAETWERIARDIEARHSP